MSLGAMSSSMGCSLSIGRRRGCQGHKRSIFDYVDFFHSRFKPSGAAGVVQQAEDSQVTANGGKM